jgi:hypothetical protein
LEQGIGPDAANGGAIEAPCRQYVVHLFWESDQYCSRLPIPPPLHEIFDFLNLDLSNQGLGIFVD